MTVEDFETARAVIRLKQLYRSEGGRTASTMDELGFVWGVEGDGSPIPADPDESKDATFQLMMGAKAAVDAKDAELTSLRQKVADMEAERDADALARLNDPEAAVKHLIDVGQILTTDTVRSGFFGTDDAPVGVPGDMQKMGSEGATAKVAASMALGTNARDADAIAASVDATDAPTTDTTLTTDTVQTGVFGTDTKSGKRK